jgi:hypothetical protein
VSRAIPSTVACACACACACALAVAACGGEDKRAGQPDPRPAAAGPVDPTPAESIDDVLDRVRGAATAASCEPVKGLLHSMYGEISDVSCRLVRAQIDGFEEPRGAEHRTGAAIEYTTASERRRLMAFALDSDRTYRLAFIEDVPGPAVGTEKPEAFDRAARQVVAALRRGDCDAFLRLVSRTTGLGVGRDRQVCRRVSDAPWRLDLLSNRRAAATPLGGNSRLAFYKLRTARDAYYTMVMERVDPPRGGRPRYVLVTVAPAG